MSDCWDNIIVGMKVEVENRDADGFGTVFAEAFWVASVLRISGYKALLRYEGFGQVPPKKPGANPTIASYNASAVNSMARL
jgi:hypothetical protein